MGKRGTPGRTFGLSLSVTFNKDVCKSVKYLKISAKYFKRAKLRETCYCKIIVRSETNAQAEAQFSEFFRINAEFAECTTRTKQLAGSLV